jgi:hypothetical protein
MKIKLFIIAILFVFQCSAQIPEIVRQQCYDNTDYDKPVGICETENGYAILTDVYNAVGTPNWHALHDFHLRLIDTVGNTVFEKCFGGSKSDRPFKILKTGDNNFLLFGKTNSDDGDIQSEIWGYNDFFVLKINPQGEILFSHTYGSTGSDTPGNIILLPENEFMFCGNITGGGGDISQYYGGSDMWLCRCDEQGEIIWQKTIGNADDDKCNVIYLNSAGNILIGGSKEVQENMYVNYDSRLIEMDMQGNFLLDTVYVSDNSDEEITMFEEISNGYAILGSSQLSGLISNQILVMNVGYNGDINWRKVIGYDGYDYPTYITHLDDGGYIVTGLNWDAPCNHHLPSAEVTYDVWMLKLNETGNIQWQQCYGGAMDEIMETGSIVKKSDYHYVIVGSTESGNSGDVTCDGNGSNVWLLEVQRCPGYEPGTPGLPAGPDTVYSANHPESTYYIDPPANAWTFNWKMEPDSAGELTGYGLYSKVLWVPDFTGMVSISAQSANYCGVSNWSEPHIITVYNTIGVPEQSKHKIKLNVYPNPAKDYAIFELKGRKDNCNIRIMNIFGETMATGTVTGGKTVIRFPGLESGIYFYRVESGVVGLSGKFVVNR